MKKPTRANKKQISLVLPAQKPVATQQATPVTQPSTAPSRRGSAPAGQPTTTPTVAEQIADRLGETKPWPRRQIRDLVWVLGNRQALDLAKRAQEVEASGGMLVANGKRRRTVGGIFFHLAYAEGKPLPGRELKRPVWKPGRKKKAAAAVAA